MIAILWTLLCSGTLFNTAAIPLSSEYTLFFLAPLESNGPAAVFVVEEYDLTYYPNGGQAPPVKFAFPAGTSVFDIADPDNDGVNDLIAIRKGEVQRYTLPQTPDAQQEPPRTLFRAESLYDGGVLQHADWLPPRAGHCVLMLIQGSRTLIGLPRETSFDLFNLDGVLALSCPRIPIESADTLNADTVRIPRDLWGSPLWVSNFALSPTTPPLFGGRNAIEMHIRTGESLWYQIPPDVLTSKVKPARVETYRVSGDWRWRGGLPLTTRLPVTKRAIVSSTGRDSTVKIEDSPSGKFSAEDTACVTGPAREYNGSFANESACPDFNGDGYVDLVLWRAPLPGMSVDSLTRALTGGSWPMTLAVHLFSPEKNRFEAKPKAHLTCNVPVTWFLHQGPLQNPVFSDFNGDGRADIACSTGPKSFRVWLYGQNGFRDTPDFTYVIPDKISRIAFREDLDGNGRTSIGLRTKSALHVLHAMP